MSKSGIEISAEDLERLTRDLDAGTLRKLLRSTLNAEARRILKAAIQELKAARTSKGKPIKDAERIAKTVRGKSYRTGEGLIVSASFSKSPERGMYLNSYFKKKPVAFWIDQGTSNRETRRKGANRGETKAAQFVEKARQRTADESAKRIVQGYEKAVERLVKKAMR